MELDAKESRHDYAFASFFLILFLLVGVVFGYTVGKKIGYTNGSKEAGINIDTNLNACEKELIRMNHLLRNCERRDEENEQW